MTVGLRPRPPASLARPGTTPGWLSRQRMAFRRLRAQDGRAGTGACSRARGALGREDGHTIAEAAVALALLVTVLIPAAALLTRLVTEERVRHRIEAAALAQAAVEEAVATRRYEGEREVGPWRMVWEAERQGPLVVLVARVYRRQSAEPLVELRTVRYEP